MSKANGPFDSIVAKLARLNPTRSRTISLLVLILFLSGFQEVKAQAVIEIDIASVKACPISLKAIWSPFGNPHPCFPNGSALKIKVPNTRENTGPLEIIVNGETLALTGLEYFSVPKYQMGLNHIQFYETNSQDGQRVAISSTKFIVYAPMVSRLRTASVSKKSYVIHVAAGSEVSEIISRLGIQNNEYLSKDFAGPGESSTSQVMVADLSVEQLAIASSSSLVAKVFEEEIVSRAAVQNSPAWGLDRVDQLARTGDGKYNYGYTGAGVDIYVIDTGIRLDHVEFTGRMPNAYFIEGNFTDGEDCDGHGTHVASIAAGTTYGAAKGATIIPVRAMDCEGSGTLSDILSAIIGVTDLHQSAEPAVLNLSLGGSFNSYTNYYIQQAINDGIVVVVAAGNEAIDACTASPASAPNAITVGASTSADQNASYSNMGTCVDIFAPGSGIIAAGIASSTATQTLSGTSMASPLVAGVAALVLEKNFASYSNKLNANALVRESLVGNAIPYALSDHFGLNSWWSDTTNRLLNTSFLTLQAQSSLQISNTNLNLVTGAATSLSTSGGTGTGPVTYRSFGLDCQVSGSTLTIAVSRSCSVIAYKAQDATYDFTYSNIVVFTAGQIQASLSISTASTSGNIGTAISITASGGSGTGALSFSVASGPCRILDSTVVAYAEGRCSISATKAADSTYASITSESIVLNFAEALTNGPWKSLSVGDNITCAITKSTEQLYCWGLNDKGQIAQPLNNSSPFNPNTAPQLVNGIPGRVVSVSAGFTHVCAVNSLASLYCWGDNGYGQLGNNSTTSSTQPETVTSLVGNVRNVSTGNYFTCATTLDSKGYCWGYGSSGRLGNGASSNLSVPTLVTGLNSGTTQISAGENHACAIQASAVKCWGNGSTGALGNGGTTSSDTPVSVNLLTAGMSTVVTGSRYSCASSGSSSYCWGDNTEGALGNGTTTGQTSPISLPDSATALKSISASYGTTCIVSNAGSVLCWGRNSSWNLGTNSPTNVQINSPSQVLGLVEGISTVDTSETHSCALAQYGRIFCWGGNSYGQLGNGGTSIARTPVQVNQLSYSLGSPRIPAFSTLSLVRRLSGFQIEISNYDPAYTWSVTSSSGAATVSVGQTGVVTVTGLSAGVSSTLTATAVRSGFETGTSTSTTISTLSLGLTPTYDVNSVTSLADGFRINVSNYDSNYQWSAVSSRESATVVISDTGTVTVSGIAPGASSNVRVSTSRTGYSSESSTSLSYNALTAYGLVPIIDSTTAVATGDGFTVNITNYDAAYSWSGTSTVNGGSVSISNTGRITMTGIASATASRAVITTSRTGYFSRSETTTAITSLLAGLVTTFDTRTPTADGFTIAISNVNNLYSYSATSNFNGGLAVVDTSTGIVTVTNITTGTPSRVTVTTNRSGYAPVSALSETVTSIPSAIATLSALTINGTNVLPPNSSVTVGNGVTSVSPVVTPTNAFATWVIESATGLVTGSNRILITVTSQNGLNIETYTATVIVSNPPAPAPAPSPAPAGGGGGGGVGTTWFNLFISSPDDPMIAYSGEACAIFILKAEDGDKTSPQICASKAGALDYEANDGNYLVRTFDKSSPKNFKEYKAKVTFGTFEVTGAGYRGGSVPRRVITVLKPSEFPVEPVVVPSPTPTPTPVPSASPTPSATTAAEPTPTFTALPSVTMENNGFVSIASKSVPAKKMTITSATTSTSVKKNAAIALSVNKIAAKSSISVMVTLPNGEKFSAASIKSYSKSTYSIPTLAFSKSGNYVVTIKIGKTTKSVKIKIS